MKDIAIINDRDYWSLYKCIGIVFVVIGHSGFTYKDFFYLFHLPAFFFVSGFFFNPKYVESNPLVFLKKRVRSLYKPYILYSLLFLCLHDFFKSIKFISEEANGLYATQYNWKDYLINAHKALIFDQQELLCGPIWFICVLFWAMMLLYVIIFLKKYAKWIPFVLSVLFAAIGFYFIYNHRMLRCRFEITLIVMPILLIGHYYSIYRDKISKFLLNQYTLILSFIFLIAATYYGVSIDMSKQKIQNPFVFYFMSITGIVFMISLCSYLYKLPKRKLMVYIGEKSLHIMAQHLVWFKIVPLFFIMCGTSSFYDLSVFPYSDKSLWLLSSVAGVLLPVTVMKLLSYFYYHYCPVKVD